MKMPSNIRSMEVTPASGKETSSTQKLDGLAKKSSVHNGSNSMKEYKTSGGVPKGNLGGRNTGS